MKTPLLIILALFLLAMKTNNDRRSLLCHQWTQFAFKKHGAASPHAVDSTLAKICEFGVDGSYRESMYSNTLKGSGQWYLNGDQTKLTYTYDELNGQKLPASADTVKHFNIIILKLTRDTLIYGVEGHYGYYKTYGHDDWYFVRSE